MLKNAVCLRDLVAGGSRSYLRPIHGAQRQTGSCQVDERIDPWRKTRCANLAQRLALPLKKRSSHGTSLKPSFAKRNYELLEIASILQEQIVNPQIAKLQDMQERRVLFQDWPGVGQFKDWPGVGQFIDASCATSAPWRL